MRDAKTLTPAQRREVMPTVAEVVSEFSAEFGEVKVEYAEEGEWFFGKRHDEGYAVSGLVMTIEKKGKK